MEGHITKYGLPLEHAAQCTVLLKFGSLNAVELASFVTTVEDVLFRCPARREVTPVYKQDEVQVYFVVFLVYKPGKKQFFRYIVMTSIQLMLIKTGLLVIKKLESDCSVWHS